MSEGFNPYEHPKYEWNGSTMVRRPINYTDIREAIEAHRTSIIVKRIHIPVEECGVRSTAL